MSYSQDNTYTKNEGRWRGASADAGFARLVLPPLRADSPPG